MSSSGIPVVYDTMLFFQAASRPTRVHATFQAILDKRVALCLSSDLLSEIADVLLRPEHEARFPALTPDAVAAFLAQWSARSRMVENVPRVFTWPEHPDDDHVFNLAIVAAARYLVTWESRILELPTRPSPAALALKQLAPELRIVTPSQLAQELRQSSNSSA